MIRTIFAAVTVLLTLAAAQAHEERRGDLVISHPWTRATASTQKVGAVFMEIVNHSNDADRLVSASSPEADTVEVHGHFKDGDVMRMRRVDGVEVPADGSAVLAPGGYHVMLIGLKGPLLEETTIDVTLEFEHAGKVEIEAIVESAGYKGPARTMNSGMPMKPEDQHTHAEMHKGMHK